MTDLTLPVQLDHDSAPDETRYITASGLPVLIYNVNGGGQYPIHGAIYIKGIWMLRKWRDDGKNSECGSHDFDLRDRPQAKRGVWVAWLPDGSIDYARTFKTKAEALEAKHHSGTLRGIGYIQEGDGLDTPADPPLVSDRRTCDD